ncbi:MULTISPECIES: glycine--tRNA ligase subunit beta [unclassified Prochlorococcus]|uniref:glycine--tRNA ligase subunit beta n=1 Tax=unclassified Prochlorococcus TaxID=2627481 RepID=UPI0005337FC3|nr:MULTISPECIES: glycine--tRNA ligase subunit beta [unclassified Prochlorococcus]KGG15149.1 Glycyl-tRNA synthetase beta chain [Prochlorococcus sp. MIT 0602]KGG17421.1 Glycyl-tRNA synthetase beta chain [Prochlorococcus sp. MIT 0603]
MSKFLLEIGTEELPADFARLVVSQLEELILRDLQQNRLGFKSITCSSTPRRIAVNIDDLANCSDDFVEERKGPPASKAFEKGCPTDAAKGFAKRYGLSLDDLKTRETPKGEFVFGNILKKGEQAVDLMVELIPKWINCLQGRRFMRWGVGDMRFSRPVRWIVALIDDKVLDLIITDADPQIRSGRLSRGHRLYEKEISISSATSYEGTLRKAGVIVNRNERHNLIQDLVENSCDELSARAGLTSKLLDELTDLVEFPSLIIGQFDQSFLELPAEVLSTVMQVHQRYIPLFISNPLIDPLALDAKGILTSNFICVSNSLPDSKILVRDGNERVLRARFSDAEFFINIDRSISSISRIDKLKKVTFADGLGSLFNRVQRIQWLAQIFIDNLGEQLSEQESSDLKRAAHLCKHDLVSQMVGEFPELQGIIGAKYLLAEGESRDVSLAVLEQYLPRGSGSQLPTSFAGSALSLIDRFELLLSIFLKGERPSGSSDPYALRRSANGLLQIIWKQDWDISLCNLLECSIDHWLKLFPEIKVSAKALLNDLFDFFHQRIISLLEESGVDIDIVHAVAGESISKERLLNDPTDVLRRVTLLEEMRENKMLSAVQYVVNRASKLAEKSTLESSLVSASEVVNPDLFEKESERAMLNVVNSLEPIAKSTSIDRYKKLADGLASGSETLSEFFDGDQSVMVMAADESVRTNRLNLLCVLTNQAKLIADFDQITH